MATLTKTFIKNLQPRKSKYTVSDSGTGSVFGLRIVVTPSGRKTWTVYYDTGKTMLNGRKQKKSKVLGPVDTIGIEAARTQAREVMEQVTGTTAAETQKKVEQYRRELESVNYVKETMQDLFECYLEDRRSEGAKTVDRIRGYLIRRMPVSLLGLEAREVKMIDVETALDHGFKTDSSWNMALTFIKAAFVYVRGTGKLRERFGLPEYNAIADIKKKRRQIQTGYIPTLEDLAELWVECENWMTPHSANLCRAIIAGCGSRPAEIQLRKWDDIQWLIHEGQRESVLEMDDTKMGKSHSIVMNELFWDCVRVADKLKDTVGHHQRDYIFPSYSPFQAPYANTSGIGNSIRRARAEGAIQNPVSLKHVRHAFSTIMGDNGVKADVIARCQNHSLGSAVNERHYSRSVFIAEKLEGATKWNELLTKAIADYRQSQESEKNAWIAAKSAG